MDASFRPSVVFLNGNCSFIRIKKTVFVLKNIFVIAKVKVINERKFIIKPVNFLGSLNPFMLMGRYHLCYKSLEDDVIHAIKLNAGTRNVSIILN